MSDPGSSTGSSSERKETQHRSAQMTLHFHEDGEICPSSFGLICPLGDYYDQPEMGELPPGIVPKLPNGIGFQSMMGGMGGMGGMGFNPAMMMGMGMGMGGGADGGDMMMATMLSAMSGGAGGFGMEGLDPFSAMAMAGGDFDMSSLAAGLSATNPSSLNGSSPFMPSMNPAMAMAMAAAASQGGMPGVGGGNPAMAMIAAMAAASTGGGGAFGGGGGGAFAGGGAFGGGGGNPAMAMMAAMAAAQGGGGGGAGGGLLSSTDSSGQPVPPTVMAARFRAVMEQAQTSMQIAQTVGNSSLAKMTDDETKTATEGKFFTTKEFVNFMQSATTEVGPTFWVLICVQFCLEHVL
jgi:hypothetical protein